MGDKKSVKNMKSSALMPRLSITNYNRSGLCTSGSSQSTKYNGGKCDLDGHTASRGWVPEVNSRRPPAPVRFHQKDLCEFQLKALVGEIARDSKYINGAILSDAEYMCLITKIIKSSYLSRASLWIVESRPTYHITLERSLFATYSLVSGSAL